jgi:hypothetical protein
MASANLFQQYLQPVRSVADYGADLDRAEAQKLQLEGLRGQNALQALTRAQQAEAARSAMDDRNALQRIASGWTAQTTDEQRATDLLNSGRAALAGQADTLRKGALERQKTEAGVIETKAKAAKEQGAAIDDTLKRYRGALDFIDTPQGAARWLQAQYEDPLTGAHLQRLGPVEQLIARIPQDPAGFQQWRQQAAVGMDKFIDNQRQQADLNLKANNELIGPDGKPNQPLIAAKKDIAKSGASSVSVNTGKEGIANELKMRDDFRSEPVYKAHSEVKSAYAQIQQGLKLASPAGDLAAATKIMKLLDPGSVVRESELGMAMAATGLLDRATSFATNILNGTKLTPQQRKDFQALADALYGESEKQFNAKGSEYETFAKDWGLNGKRITGGPSTKPNAGTAAPAAGTTVLKFDANGNPVK